MRSSTSSSDARFFAALAITLGVLLGSWEAVLRLRASATVDLAINAPPLAQSAQSGEEWVIFGNCLMMTGVSPKGLNEQIGDRRERVITNIAWHEQSPIAFFEYLKRANRYPDVVITNVSSWLNGTNFEQEGELVTKADPLGAIPKKAADGQAKPAEQAYKLDDPNRGRFQNVVEDGITAWTSKHVQSVGHRYHLFDYTLFLGTLATTADLDVSLYQLNMQSWFRVTESETDGRGYLGLKVRYRDDWSRGLDRMAERSLQRMRLSNLLTPRYWELLEQNVKDFQSHGTQVLLVRMPEHPKIRAFNDETYDVPGKLRGIEERNGTPVLDLSKLGPDEGVHLFDAVHPDAEAAQVITREVASWMQKQRLSQTSRRPRPGVEEAGP